MSPVDKWGTPYASANRTPWVPLPAPGGANNSARSAMQSDRNVDAGRLPEGDEVVDDEVDHVPQIGHELAARHQAEVEGVQIALHGDVEPLPVDDGRHRVVVQQPGPGRVERLARSGDVRDDQVHRGERRAGRQAGRGSHGPGEYRGWRELGEVGEGVGRDG